MPINIEEQAYNHFVIPAKPDFFEVDLQLSEASKELFAKGAPGQGFVGLVDLETNLIHLFPAFNKDDGQLRLDKEGKKFAKLAETAQSLGGGSGDLHMRTAGTLGLGEKAGNKQNLMGFGIWKAGQSVKFLAEMPDNNLRLIPDEYWVVKDENNQWKICYVDFNKVVTDVPLNESQKAALAKLPTDVPPEKVTFEQRKPILDALKINDPGHIKLIKNRSSSQNMFSCKYLPIYGEFFSNLMPPGHSGSHQIALQRELPLPVFSKIINSVCEGLNLPSCGDYLETSDKVPMEANDNRLRYHLELESFWIRLQNILKAFNAQTNENSQFIAKYFNNINRVHWPESKVRLFIGNLESNVKENKFGIEIFLLIMKHQEHYEKLLFLANRLNKLIEKCVDSPGALNGVLSTLENNIATKNQDEILSAIADSIIEAVKKGDLKVTADSFKYISEFLVSNFSHTDTDKLTEYLDFLTLIKNDNNINALIADGVAQQSITRLLKVFVLKAEKTSDTTEQRKIIALLENHSLIKSIDQIFMAHLVKYYDDYKNSPSLTYLIELLTEHASEDLHFGATMSTVISALKKANADEPFKELVKDIVSQDPEAGFRMLQFLKSEEWSAFDETIKEIMPKEHALYTIIKEQLNIMPEVYIDLGSDSVRYAIDFDQGTRSIMLNINPPGVIEYGYDGAVVDKDTRNFRESFVEVLAKLKDLGFPQHALDKVSNELNANLDVNYYQIELDQATQLAIIEKNQKKPAVEKGVEAPKAERRKSLLMSDKHRLLETDKENATQNQTVVEVSRVRPEKP